MRHKLALASIVLLLSADMLAAQNFPQQPVTIIVPYTAGGTTDAIIRPVQNKLASLLGQAVIVDNRPGGGGNIGGAYVARAKPDGHTLLLQSTVIGMYKYLFPNMTYDPLKDFAPITSIAETPSLFVVRSESPFRTLKDFADATKSKAQGTTIGNSGAGSPAHLVAVQFSKLNDFRVTHIPYKGTAPLVTDLLGGQIDMAIISVGGAAAQLQSGQFRALAVASPKRSPLVPDVPTIKEAGFAEMSGGVRFFLAAPAGTPSKIVSSLASAFQEALKDVEIAERIKRAGFDIVTSSPDEAQAMLLQQNEMWGPVARELGLKLE